MSLAVAIIVVVVLLVIAFAGLALVMSRPKELRPHRPGPRGWLSWRGRRGGTGPAR
jgi:hypothetical protein